MWFDKTLLRKKYRERLKDLTPVYGKPGNKLLGGSNGDKVTFLQILNHLLSMMGWKSYFARTSG
jgi:hypothetical protein